MHAPFVSSTHPPLVVTKAPPAGPSGSSSGLIPVTQKLNTINLGADLAPVPTPSLLFASSRPPHPIPSPLCRYSELPHPRTWLLSGLGTTQHTSLVGWWTSWTELGHRSYTMDIAGHRAMGFGSASSLPLTLTRPASAGVMFYSGVSTRSRGRKPRKAGDLWPMDSRPVRQPSLKKFDGAARSCTGWDFLRKVCNLLSEHSRARGHSSAPAFAVSLVGS